MARHRSPRGRRPEPVPRGNRSHRVAPPSPTTRGRIVVAAVATGAVVSALQGADWSGPADEDEAAPEVALAANPVATGVGGTAPAPVALPLPELDHTGAVQALAKGEQLLAKQLEREAERKRPHFVLPAVGTFTSGFGARWGTNHWGIDLANKIGTPIRAAADGVVVESGPASGFGMWVKLRHADGFTTIYGHINRSLVQEGERVRAGQQIAEMGNRGYSTGPHLHFEVWDPEGAKVNPMIWMNQHHLQP